jgi:hypothetical protein
MIFIIYSLILFSIISLLRNTIKNSNINTNNSPKILIYIYFYQKLLNCFQFLGLFIFLIKITPLKKFFFIIPFKLMIYHFIFLLNIFIKDFVISTDFNINLHIQLISGLMFLDTIKIT